MENTRQYLQCGTLLRVTPVVSCVLGDHLYFKRSFNPPPVCFCTTTTPCSMPGDNITPRGTAGDRSVCENTVISAMCVLIDWIEGVKFIHLGMFFLPAALTLYPFESLFVGWCFRAEYCLLFLFCLRSELKERYVSRQTHEVEYSIFSLDKGTEWNCVRSPMTFT